MQCPARLWAALFFCMLAGCLSERSGSNVVSSGNLLHLQEHWRGDLPQSPPPVPRVATSQNEQTISPPRQPQPETLLILAQRCYETAGDAARDPEQRYEHYQRALHIYRQVLRQNPNHAAARLGQARIYKKQGQLDQAIAELQQLVGQSPQLAAAWYELGMCYGARQDWHEQIRCLQQACQLEPDNTHYGTHLGLALARAERWGEAERQLTRVVGPGRANYYLALMAEHLGRHDLQTHYARNAVQTDPTLRRHPRWQQVLDQKVSESGQR